MRKKMKNKLILSFILFYFLLGVNTLFAQSDYEIVKNFKEKVREIEKAIRDSDSLDALADVNESINQLRSDFISHKKLLDSGLYPESFDKTIEKLKNSYALRSDDFMQIDVLKTEVTGLREVVDTLNRRNVELTDQFAILEKQSNDDRTRIAQLEQTIAQLKSSLQKRDEIVKNMIDSLLPSSFSGEDLNTQEKQQLLSEAERNNILFHIKRAVSDNIRFLKATKLYPDDIEEIKDQQEDFLRIWKSVGPTITELYSEKGKNTNELKEIDEAFTNWHIQLEQETWESLKQEFTENNINLRNFSNGKEFAAALSSYISDEIKNAEVKGKDKAEAAYKNFADSTWYSEIDPDWVPFLIDNNMLAEEEKDSIEVMIASWRDNVYPDGTKWIYIIAGVILLAVVILLFTRKSKKITPTEQAG